MTPQEIKEGNEKIARFMGWNQQNNDSKRWYGQWFNPVTGKSHVYLLFQTYWDWLMPVVEKINGMTNEEHDFLYLVTIRPDYCEVFSSDGCCEIVRNENGSTMLEMVYVTLIQFIDWYNSENLDQDGYPACKVYRGETVLPNEDGKCSLCEGDCTEQ